jgi:hypothetical protein
VVRFGRLAGALALLLAGALAPAAQAQAQGLPRLTVTSFTLSADTTHPQLETPFHLIVSLHVKERVTSIETLELPILAELELQGDERTLRAGPDGTDYRETIAVIAHHTGSIVVAPATLQAIDARDGRPKQYFTNQLELRVGGGTLEPLQTGASIVTTALFVLVRIGAIVIGIVALVAVIVLVARRRPRPAPPVPVAQPQPAAAAPVPRARSRREQLDDAYSVLRAERTRLAAVTVRSAVRRMVGASDGETLDDVLRRPEAREAPMRELLRSLERAAFTYDADLAGAIDAACAAFERILA